MTISNSVNNDAGSRTLPSKALPSTKGQVNVKTIQASGGDLDLIKTSQSMMYFNSTSTFVDKSNAGTMASSTFVTNKTMGGTVNGTFVDKSNSNTVNKTLSGTFVDKTGSNTFTGTFVDKSGGNTLTGTFVDKSGHNTLNKTVPGSINDESIRAKMAKKPLPKIPLNKAALAKSNADHIASQTSPRRATFGESALAKSSPTIVKPTASSDEFKPSPSSPSLAGHPKPSAVKQPGFVQNLIGTAKK